MVYLSVYPSAKTVKEREKNQELYINYALICIQAHIYAFWEMEVHKVRSVVESVCSPSSWNFLYTLEFYCGILGLSIEQFFQEESQSGASK